MKPLSDNRFITYSDKEATIKVWKGEVPFSDTPIKVISLKGQKFFVLGYIREREYLLVEEYLKHLIFVYSMKTYQIVIVFTCVKEFFSFKTTFNHKVVLQNKGKILFVDLDLLTTELVLMKELEIQTYSMIQFGEDIILMNNGYNKFVLYNHKTKTYRKSFSIEKNYNCIVLNNELFLSSDFECLRVWEYKQI